MSNRLSVPSYQLLAGRWKRSVSGLFCPALPCPNRSLSDLCRKKHSHALSSLTGSLGVVKNLPNIVWVAGKDCRYRKAHSIRSVSDLDEWIFAPSSTPSNDEFCVLLLEAASLHLALATEVIGNPSFSGIPATTRVQKPTKH